jgi:hypothetical protein
MPWTVTLHVVDCTSPSTNISGATITDPDISILKPTDQNGLWIFTELDDTIYGQIVQISKLGYIAKNFELDQTQAGTVQTVCLSPSPHGTTDPNVPTGRGGSTTGCLIVSAATGSSESVEVRRLQQLRGRVATASCVGGQLIEAILRDYYQFSPEIAAELDLDEIARKAVLLVVVRPLVAWYTLAGALGIERSSEDGVSQALHDLSSACAYYPDGASIITMLEAVSAGRELNPNTPPLLLEVGPRIREAARLRFTSWAILDPLVRTWQSAINRLDPVDQVAQWLATTPLEALSPPIDTGALEAEMGVLASYFDFNPAARRQLGDRLTTAWPDAVNALERTGFISQALN